MLVTWHRAKCMLVPQVLCLLCPAVCARCPWRRGRACSRLWTCCTKSWSSWAPWSKAASAWTARLTMPREIPAVIIFLSVCFWALEFRFIDHINALTHEGDLMSMSRWGCRVFYPLFVWLFAKKKRIAGIWTVVNDLLAYNLSNRSLTNDSESFWVRKNISITKQNLFFGKVIFISPLFMQLSVTDIKKNSREIWHRGQEKLWQI